MTANARPVPPSFDECANFIGAAWEDRALTEWLKAHRFGKREKMEPVEGEPRAAYVRNEKLGVIVELEDDQVAGFSLELLAPAPAPAPALPDGVAFGAARAAVAKAWGAPAETSRRHDTFKRPYGEKKKPLRVTCTFIKDVLEDVQVEWWSRLVEREARESVRTGEN